MKLYNTLSRSIEDFKPINGNLVKMYTCGPTVYNFAHLGNLRIYIHEDVLEKTLRYIGYDVKRVMNITDVGHLESDSDEGEDKMLKGAKRENKTVMEIAQHYTDAFFSDIKKLNIKKPLNCFRGFRGIVRIRTGVGAFAEPSLAARPRRHYLNGWQK